MALIKYSEETEPLRGSIQGQSFHSGSFGFSISNKAKGRVFRSPLQLEISRWFIAATQGWKQLSTTSKNAWLDWAALFPQKNKKFPNKNISAFHNFVKSNFYQKFYTNDPAAILSEPVLILYDPETLSAELLVSNDSILLNLSFSLNDSHQMLILSLSKYRSSGNFFVDRSTRLILSCLNQNQSVDVTGEYLRKFGKMPEPGEKHFLRWIFTGIDNGQFTFEAKEVIISQAGNLTIFAGVYSESYPLAKSEDSGVNWDGISTVDWAEVDFISAAPGIAFLSGWLFDWVGTFWAYSNDNFQSFQPVTASFFNSESGDMCRQVAYSGSIYIAALDSAVNSLAWSVDGINWSGLGNSVFPYGCRCVIWDGSKFIAGGFYSNIIAYSSNGIDWTMINVESMILSVDSIAFNDDPENPVYVAVGSGAGKPNNILYSSDGINWSGAGKPVFDFYGMKVKFILNQFMAIGVNFSSGNCLARSSDGINWSGSLFLSDSYYLTDMFQAGNSILIGGSDGSGAIIFSSSDFENFDSVAPPFDIVNCFQ